MRVAVLGAGFQGTCIALELASRGVEVDLYDQDEQPITRSGFVNEGRIHLGFNYANDPSLRTASLMVKGALLFRRNLNRWIDFDAELENCSESVIFAVHRDSLVSAERFRSYFGQVGKCVTEMLSSEGGDYLGGDGSFLFEELNSAEVEEIFDPRLVSAAFRALERAIPVISVAERLREAVTTSAICFRPHSRVEGVGRKNGKFRVDIGGENGGASNNYDQVVNALWAGRLAVDADLGYPAERAWLHRFKYGVFIDPCDPAARPPSVAITCGPFGDIVRYADGSLYLSWYPACLKAISAELHPPILPVVPDAPTSRRIFEDTWKELSTVCPALGPQPPFDECRMVVRGGVIVAWGQSDIDEADSELHARGDVGTFSENGYHSVNTGKYTLAPMLAVEVGERICSAAEA